MTDAASTMASAAQPPSSFAMIRTLGSVAMLSGFLIVITVSLTEGRIAENRRRALEDAVFTVLPGAFSRATFEVTNDGFMAVEERTPGTRVVYAGYDDAGSLVGVAFEASGQGYKDVIRALFGYSPEEEVIIGFEVLESTETPGLGDRIATDPTFLANFDGLDASLDADGESLANPITFVAPGEKENPWEVDGISGATISCVTVVTMLNTRAQEIIPWIHQHLDQLQGGGA